MQANNAKTDEILLDIIKYRSHTIYTCIQALTAKQLVQLQICHNNLLLKI